MSSFYTRYPSQGGGAGVPTYANFAALPGSAANGSLAVTLDTGFLYEYNAGTPGWQLIASGIVGPGSSTNRALVRWNGTTGTTLENSNATLSDAGALTLASDLFIGGASGARFSNNLTDAYLYGGMVMTSSLTTAPSLILNNNNAIGSGCLSEIRLQTASSDYYRFGLDSRNDRNFRFTWDATLLLQALTRVNNFGGSGNADVQCLSLQLIQGTGNLTSGSTTVSGIDPAVIAAMTSQDHVYSAFNSLAPTLALVTAVGANTFTVSESDGYPTSGGSITDIVSSTNYTYTAYNNSTRVFTGVSPNPVGVMAVGDKVYASFGIALGTTFLVASSTSITLSQPATATVTAASLSFANAHFGHQTICQAGTRLGGDTSQLNIYGPYISASPFGGGPGLLLHNNDPLHQANGFCSLVVCNDDFPQGGVPTGGIDFVTENHDTEGAQLGSMYMWSAMPGSGFYTLVVAASPSPTSTTCAVVPVFGNAFSDNNGSFTDTTTNTVYTYRTYNPSNGNMVGVSPDPSLGGGVGVTGHSVKQAKSGGSRVKYFQADHFGNLILAVGASSTISLLGTTTLSAGAIFSYATASTAAYFDSGKNLISSATTGTELNYVSGVTSAIQTQLNSKAPLASPVFTGSVTLPNTGSATDGGSNLGTLDGTGTDSKRFNAGYFKIFETIGDYGTRPPISSLTTDVGLRIGVVNDNPSVSLYSANSNGSVALLRMRQSRGTIASPTATQANDYLGQIDFANYNGSAFVSTALIYAQATGSASSDLTIQAVSGTVHTIGSVSSASGSNFDIGTTNFTVAAVAAFTNNSFVLSRGAGVERLRLTDSTGNFGTNSAPIMTFRDAAGTSGFEIGFDGGASKSFNFINRLSAGPILFYTSAATLAMTLDASQNAIVVGQVRAASLGVGNSASATVAVGVLTKKIEVFDAGGSSLGFVPVYATIT